MPASSKKQPPTNWNLAQLYRSDSDKAIEADLLAMEKTCKAFRKKWHGKISDEMPIRQLSASLQAYSELYATLQLPKTYLYFSLRSAIETDNSSVSAKRNAVHQRCMKAFNDVLFFELELAKLSTHTLRTLKEHPSHRTCAHFFERIEQQSKHMLTESEEKIIALKSLPARELWVQGVEKAVSAITVTHKGAQIPIAEANSLIGELPTKQRRDLHASVMKELANVSNFAESELTALYLDKKTSDELRGFKKPYSETILTYDNKESSIVSFVDTVTNAFSISHDFYKLKKQLLGLDALTYADRNASVGTLKHSFTFEHSSSLFRDVLYETKTEYGEIFDRVLKHGQIDVFPKPGKKGGAFQASGIGVPSYILLNHTDDFRSAQTLAHEMGHLLHSERSRGNHPLVEKYTISAAETASTFFEGLFTERLLSELSDKEQVIALHDIIQNDVSTIFRQIAFFNFEQALHEHVRTTGGADTPTILKLMNTHMQAYLGSTFELEGHDAYFFVQVPHIRNFFYVYSYAYGQLISKTMLSRYKEDASYIEHVDQFLSAGGSASPDDIFASIGLNTKKPEIFAGGLQEIRKNVTKLKKLMK